MPGEGIQVRNMPLFAAADKYDLLIFLQESPKVRQVSASLKLGQVLKTNKIGKPTVIHRPNGCPSSDECPIYNLFIIYFSSKIHF